jgi:hypothetical protein
VAHLPGTLEMLAGVCPPEATGANYLVEILPTLLFWAT